MWRWLHVCWILILQAGAHIEQRRVSDAICRQLSAAVECHAEIVQRVDYVLRLISTEFVVYLRFQASHQLVRLNLYSQQSTIIQRLYVNEHFDVTLYPIVAQIYKEQTQTHQQEQN